MALGRSALSLVGVLAIATLCAGCALSVHNISDLKQHPAKYHDKTVNISGVVTSSWGIPLVPFRFYKVDDGTGEVTVLAAGAHAAPINGERVRVKGRVEDVAIVGGQPIGLHLREEDISISR